MTQWHAYRRAQASTTHHLRRFGPRDVKLLVGVLLPVAKEKRELEEETIVGVAEGGDGLGARVSVKGAVHLARADKLLPGLEAVGIGVLAGHAVSYMETRRIVRRWRSRRHTTSALSLLISAFSSSEPPKWPKSAMVTGGTGGTGGMWRRNAVAPVGGECWGEEFYRK